MTTPHDPLPRFTAATRDAAEQVFAARVPDFAAMLARARELDPAHVTAEKTAQAEALAPVIPIHLAHRDRSDQGALAPFTAATRAVLADQAHPTRRPPPPTPPRRRPLVITAVLAAAAALLLWQAPRMAQLLTPTPSSTMAIDHNTAAPPRPLEPPPDPPSVHPQRPAPLEPPVLEPTAPAIPDPQPPPSPPEPIKPRSPRRPTLTTSLEDEAQTLWQRGELAAAEQKLREVTRTAGKSPRAELAYGDLFALAGQIRGPAGQTALAREYLRAFPSGRFADDMRAGLCQRAPADERPACWRDYLTHHPNGAHRRSAETP